MTRLDAATEAEARLTQALEELGSQLEPSEFEVAAARARLTARAWRTRTRPRKFWLPALAAVFFGGAAFAFGVVRNGSQTESEVGSPADAGAAKAAGGLRRGRVTPESPPRLAETPEVAEPAGEMAARPAAMTLDSLPKRESESVRTRGWSAVADALREGDQVAAERELLRLVAAGGSEREGAELALAQLWLRRGETNRAELTLRTLAKKANDPVVRARAQALLEKSKQSAPN